MEDVDNVGVDAVVEDVDNVVVDAVVVLSQLLQISFISPSLTKSTVEVPYSSTTSRVSLY